MTLTCAAPLTLHNRAFGEYTYELEEEYILLMPNGTIRHGTYSMLTSCVSLTAWRILDGEVAIRHYYSDAWAPLSEEQLTEFTLILMRAQ